MAQLIECVPNFSEGKDPFIIQQIADTIQSVNGVKLLNIDPGKAANRTVYTFIGEPNNVVEAAFKAIQKASQLIDMSKHKGEHPRIGATDVCPFIPISGITLQETSNYARILAERVGNQLNIPVFLYEASQDDKRRSNLADIRKGEFEGMFQKIKKPEWNPDFGPAENSLKSGATVIGARNFLIAYNINLNTKSVDIASKIAAEVRESGYVIKRVNQTEKVPGLLKSVKAIGWYIEEYGFAQVSMNLTDMNITGVHEAYEAVCNSAQKHQVKVTGSELIGLIPLKAIIDAGVFYLNKQGKCTDDNDTIIQTAIDALGLNQLSRFIPEKRIFEYLL
jgi:glutamate formiminotransferase / formiminotetrahydrofolate cyclodeaminase